MLDQQPKTNQVKQQPHSSSGCWARLLWRLQECPTVRHICFQPDPGVFVFNAIHLTLKPAWMELWGTDREWRRERAREGGRSVCVRMKERASWGFNPLLFPDCYTSDSYCAKHSCLWGRCQFNVPQLFFSPLTSTEHFRDCQFTPHTGYIDQVNGGCLNDHHLFSTGHMCSCEREKSSNQTSDCKLKKIKYWPLLL